MRDDALILGLLNTLERDLLPAIERGEVEAWGRANRLADAILALLPSGDRDSVGLPSRVGALQALYVAGRESRDDRGARSSALYTFVKRGKDAIDPQRRLREKGQVHPPPSSRPGSIVPPPHSILPPPDRQMPAWVPESGIVGGFRLVRPMASGGLGSLFLAHRLEDEGDPLAREVVVKVPHDESTIHSAISEDELHAQFRAEASALAAIPVHANLARILAFDIAAKPKPFLVMELVEGRTLEAELDERTLTMERAFAILDGVLAGLDAMHSTGVGHLDIKPDNVILRRETGAATLVDFGLSGRTVRKRCGNPIYSAPEVWNDDRAPESAFAADAYSFACLAFEVLTGKILFDGTDIFAIIRLHLASDGWPSPLASLRARPEHRKLAEILSRALRPNPSQRTRIRMLRTELTRAFATMRDLPWPLFASPSPSTPPPRNERKQNANAEDPSARSGSGSDETFLGATLRMPKIA